MYLKIYDLWKKETNSEEITEIESEFLSSIAEYIKKLQNKQKKTKNITTLTLKEQKLENLTHMVKELFRLRVKKSLKVIINGNPLQKSAYCVEELKIFSEIDKLLQNYLERLNLLVKGETPQVTINENLNGEFFVIRFLTEVPQIIGTDLKKYGPFLAGDVAILPKKNMETLLNHRAIALINKK